MGRFKPLSKAEKMFIEDNYPRMTKSAIADALERNPSTIGRYVADNDLDSRPVATVAARAGKPRCMTRLERLQDLRDMLLQAMALAQPREMAAIAREYRATIESIERLEGSDDGEPDGLSALAASIAERMQA